MCWIQASKGSLDFHCWDDTRLTCIIRDLCWWLNCFAYKWDLTWTAVQLLGVKDLQFQIRSLLTTTLWGSSIPDWWKTGNVSYLHPWRLGKCRGWQFKWPKSVLKPFNIFRWKCSFFSPALLLEIIMHGGRARWRWNSPDSMTKAHPASSGVACGLSTEIFCYFHNLVISKLPKVRAGSGEGL